MDRTTSVVQTSIGLEGNSAGKNERIYSVGRESEFCKSRYDRIQKLIKNFQVLKPWTMSTHIWNFLGASIGV